MYNFSFFTVLININFRYVYPLLDDVEYNLTVAIKIPFDYKDSVKYPIVYACLAVVFNFVSYFVMTNDLVIQVILIHMLCQYAVLADCFRNIIIDSKYSFVITF